MRSFVFVCLCGWDEKRSTFEFVAFTEDTLLVEEKTMAFAVGIEVNFSLSLGIAHVEILPIVIAMLAAPGDNDYLLLRKDENSTMWSGIWDTGKYLVAFH